MSRSDGRNSPDHLYKTRPLHIPKPSHHSTLSLAFLSPPPPAPSSPSVPVGTTSHPPSYPRCRQHPPTSLPLLHLSSAPSTPGAQRRRTAAPRSSTPPPLPAPSLSLSAAVADGEPGRRRTAAPRSSLSACGGDEPPAAPPPDPPLPAPSLSGGPTACRLLFMSVAVAPSSPAGRRSLHSGQCSLLYGRPVLPPLRRGGPRSGLLAAAARLAAAGSGQRGPGSSGRGPGSPSPVAVAATAAVNADPDLVAAAPDLLPRWRWRQRRRRPALAAPPGAAGGSGSGV
ncbi:unnamed protein product [Urochloa humidicola]